MPGIDDWMPVYDESSRHSLPIAASQETVWEALFSADLSSHFVIRALLALRSVPMFLVAPRKTRIGPASRSGARGIGSFLSGEFVLLDENPPQEVVLGLTGRFWTPTGDLQHTDPSTFRDEVPPGLARAAWAFVLSPNGGGTTLTTETRVRCGGERTRRAFRTYWRLIRPFSGLIRLVILGQVRKRAEAPGEPPV